MATGAIALPIATGRAAAMLVDLHVCLGGLRKGAAGRKRMGASVGLGCACGYAQLHTHEQQCEKLGACAWLQMAEQQGLLLLWMCVGLILTMQHGAASATGCSEHLRK